MTTSSSIWRKVNTGIEQQLKTIYGLLYPFAKVSGAQPWSYEVRSLDVVLHRAGRAVIREPVADWSVELRWEAPRGGRRIRDFEDLHIVGCQIVPDTEGTGWLPLGDLSIGKYVTALYFELLHQERFGSRVKQRVEPPTAGKPPSVAFYRALLADLQQLKREGHPSPTKELARRYRQPLGTMKSWLHRARNYVGSEK
jgi:hypothetical protein